MTPDLYVHHKLGWLPAYCVLEYTGGVGNRRVFYVHVEREGAVFAYPVSEARMATYETRTPEEMAACEAGRALHLELSRAGVRDTRAFAAKALRRETAPAFRALSRDERNAVRDALYADYA